MEDTRKPTHDIPGRASCALSAAANCTAGFQKTHQQLSSRIQNSAFALWDIPRIITPDILDVDTIPHYPMRLFTAAALVHCWRMVDARVSGYEVP
jgi:hypothetical protein